MKSLNQIKFYLTRDIYKELLSAHDWAERVVYKKKKPVHVTLDLKLLYHKEFLKGGPQYAHTTPNPNGVDVLLSADQAMLLIHSSKLIGLPELTYLAASLHKENKQNKL